MTVTYNQRGYVGSSMSVRALEAYARGEMPLSKWNRTAMIAELSHILDGGIDAGLLEHTDLTTEDLTGLPRKDVMAAFIAMPKNILLGAWLTCTSWHHTSKYANETLFYYPDIERLHSVVNYAIGQGMDVREYLMDDAERWAACHYIDWHANTDHKED
ncbi:hypothetical protein BW14_06060 [Bifidobacterium sp. UTBIF-68]|uniref:hypothetical protein n=1 Tax=Bifidobacterium sp. UTBIF-68 TaxID=1465262 RepID=UPI00112BE734|nr:hypothetical protein [Bifidobacterium sp. UTBIF-68]TPF93238.1 hypothetical protein BW14_06060 [Bifidobacterium sp. UTBIF-68]